MSGAEIDPHQRIRDLIAARIDSRLDEGRTVPGCRDLADAVMELFPEVELIQEGRYADGSWPQRAHEFPNYIDPTHTRFELRTAPEPVKPRADHANQPAEVAGGPQ